MEDKQTILAMFDPVVRLKLVVSRMKPARAASSGSTIWPDDTGFRPIAALAHQPAGTSLLMAELPSLTPLGSDTDDPSQWGKHRVSLAEDGGTLHTWCGVLFSHGSPTTALCPFLPTRPAICRAAMSITLLHSTAFAVSLRTST